MRSTEAELIRMRLDEDPLLTRIYGGIYRAGGRAYFIVLNCASETGCRRDVWPGVTPRDTQVGEEERHGEGRG